MWTMLTAEQRAEVRELRRDGTVRPADRDRVEMVLSSAAGWAAPRIATHLGCCVATVRRVLHRFAAEGVASVRRRRPGPAPDAGRRDRVEGALRALLAQERAWTAAQLAAALAEQGIALSARQVRRYLRGLRGRYRRTVRSLRHKQDSAKVSRATRVLASLEAKPGAGA